MAQRVTCSDFFWGRIFKSKSTMDTFLQDPTNMERILHFVPRDEIDVYDEVDPRKTPHLRQDGKVVAITGGGRGIGKAVALMFARANARAIAICARTVSELEETRDEIIKINPSTTVHIGKVDVKREEDVKLFFEEVGESLGKIDIMVSNSGANSSFEPLMLTATERWWEDCEINIKGTYLIAKYFASQLQGSTGTLVHVSSCHALAAVPGQSAYCGSKIAAARIMETLHHEAPNIRCFSVHPGAVNTVLLQDLENAMGFKLPWKWTTPDLTGGMILWLTTNRAEFLRGRWLSSNWRVNDLEMMEEEVRRENLLKLAFNARLGYYAPKPDDSFPTSLRKRWTALWRRREKA